MEHQSATPSPWLIRIAEVFDEFVPEIIAGLGATLVKRLGSEYFLIQRANLHASTSEKFLRWNLPVEHSWPCNPAKMDGFVEKAAQTIFRKFGARNPQAIFMGQLDPAATNRYYKTLASNLRGRTLQLFPEAVASFKDVEMQNSELPTLFCLIGNEGLFCGLQSPLAANGFYPGGTKYISQNSPDTISRAGAKIAEALHYLGMYPVRIDKKTHWLELGASPGGMTSELLDRGYQVTAIDRAALDKRLDSRPGLHFAMMDVASFRPNSSMRYGAILSDMNGDPRDATGQVIRLSTHLKPGGILIFTLKTQGVTTFAEMNDLHSFATDAFEKSGLRHFSTTHLTYNRHELTLFLERPR